MGIADGEYKMVLISTGLILGALLLLTKLEQLIDRINQSITYKITSAYKEDLLKEYENICEECGLKFKRLKRTKSGNDITGLWLVHGPEKKHNKFTRILLHHPSVKEFEF
jgi:putative Mg2+ transporter-C (MgtC) family protein